MLITAIVAIIVLFVFAMVVGSILRMRENNWLEQNGKHINAVITRVEKRREPYQVAHTHQQFTGPNSTPTTHTTWETQWQDYYYVYAEWRDPQTRLTYTFKSERRSGYPGRSMKEGEMVDVAFDPNDPTRYFMKL